MASVISKVREQRRRDRAEERRQRREHRRAAKRCGDAPEADTDCRRARARPGQPALGSNRHPRQSGERRVHFRRAGGAGCDGADRPARGRADRQGHRDLRTAVPDSAPPKTQPKAQPRWLSAAYGSFVNKGGSNYQMSLGVVFPYEQLPGASATRCHRVDCSSMAGLQASRGFGPPAMRNAASPSSGRWRRSRW